MTSNQELHQYALENGGMDDPPSTVQSPIVGTGPSPSPATHEEARQFHEGFLSGATAYAAAVGHSTLKRDNPKLCEVFDAQGWRTIETFEKVAAATCTVPNRRNFDDELVCLLNKYSKENGSNTPDFILADFIGRCLENWNLTTVTREEWYGRSFSPGALRHDLHVCEHGVKDGDWCEPCNKAAKAGHAEYVPLTLHEDGTFERMDEPAGE